jgi:methylenetetrahydrofolate dehydrogenase (NADP+) / methenyltetrahydrofolate cyclohydrolase
MSARIISGKDLAARVRGEVKDGVTALAPRGVVPGLAVVLVGEDPASAIYVRNKTKAAAECGVRTFDHKPAATIAEAELMALVARLNADPEVDGILVQLPLPKHIDARRILEAVSPAKDVDGFHPENVGLLAQGTPRFVACTPKGCLALLREAGAELRGARCLVVGRSNIVGKPMALLLLAEDATVTIAHSRTRALEDEVRRADVVVAAVGKAELVRGAWIKEGAVVIDVGMNRLEGGKLVGDVEFEPASQRARAITPVPGGVGPMTIAMLLSNTLDSARARAART